VTMDAVKMPARSGAELVRDIRTRMNRMGWIANAAGMLVVCISIGFLYALLVHPDERVELGLLNLSLGVVYFLAAGLLWCSPRVDRHNARVLWWIVEERQPNEREHHMTLGAAAYAAKPAVLAWIVGGLLFFALNAALHSWGFAAAAGATIWLGGETTCAIVYLASERILRPATALALAARPPSAPVSPGVRDRLLFAWALGTMVPLLGILVVGIVTLTKSGVDTEDVAAAGIFLAVVAMAVSLLVTLYASRAIADPVSSVRAALERVESGDLDAQVTVDDGSEVGQLQAGFNRMAEGLRERAQLRDLFGRQVGRDVARAALRNPPKLGGEEREVGVLYVDLVGSTSMALAMPPTEVVRLLNLFFRVVVESVEARRGLVNKFEGDAALCVFGAPVACPDPAGDALLAARELSRRLRREVPQVDFGIGVSAGRAVAGNVGAEQRFEYTVIGDPVNEAARLSRLAREHSERVVSSDAALRRARSEERDAWSLGEPTFLPGRAERTGVAIPRGG
jgi:adenylate cyclase